jgi:hypothetical protein
MQNKLSKAHWVQWSIINNLRSWNICERNGWFIKLSIHREVNILLIFTSTFTGQTIVRYFTDEDEAVNFINFIIEKDADETIRP